MYDLPNPGLSTLQQLSINAVIVSLWRWKINKYRTEGTLSYYHYFSRCDILEISIKRLMPNIPPKIYNLIEEYATRFGLSVNRWLYERYYYRHNDMGLLNKGTHVNDILNSFDDFAIGDDGSIHNVRTARRMLLSDRISQIDKFNIACEYCFEEDVRRLWPSVSAQIDLSKLSPYKHPLQYYWVHQITSQLSKESRTEYINRGFPPESISNETMLELCPPHAWSSFRYFWHKLTLERQWEMVSRMLQKSKLVFAKFILPMMNEEHLISIRFAAKKGADFVFKLIIQEDKCEDYYYDSPYDGTDDYERQMCVLSAWNCIKNKMNEYHFTKMVSNMLDRETNSHIVKDALSDTDKRYSHEKRHSKHEFETLCFCELWSSAPENLKLSATEHILPTKRFSKRSDSSPFEARETQFLVEILQSTTWETKKVFWNNNWYYLMTATRLQDLQQIMQLCFDSENKINQFKKDVMSRYENIEYYCITLFQKCCFKKLDSFLTFCYPETQTRKYFKQRFLKSNLLCENSIFDRIDHIDHGLEINRFIDDAYETVDLATEAKNEFMTLFTVLVNSVPTFIFSKLSAFVDAFELMDEVKRKLRQDFVEKLKSSLINGYLFLTSAKSLQEFVVWCLGEEDEVIKFKQSISPVEVLHNTARKSENHKKYSTWNLCTYYSDDDYCRNFSVFLKWYFVDANKIKQFEIKYSEVIGKFMSKEMKDRVERLELFD